MFKALIYFFRGFFEPSCKERYFVTDSTSKRLATLTKPVGEDMFWNSFLLTPTVSDNESLNKLYSHDFWDGDDEIQFFEADSGRRVLFFLQGYEIENVEVDEDDFVYISILSKRPSRITLRGPYRFSAKKET